MKSIEEQTREDAARKHSDKVYTDEYSTPYELAYNGFVAGAEWERNRDNNLNINTIYFSGIQYNVSSDGKIYCNGEEVKYYKTRNGYLTCYIDGKLRKVHRIIAQSFIINPLYLLEVNHKDGNKLNNCVNNLEWIDRSGNMKHAVKMGLWKPKRKSYHKLYKKCGKLSIHSKPVVGTNIKTGEKIYFESMRMAASKGFSNSQISMCVNGKRKSHKGFVWNLDNKPLPEPPKKEV